MFGILIEVISDGAPWHQSAGKLRWADGQKLGSQGGTVINTKGFENRVAHGSPKTHWTFNSHFPGHLEEYQYFLSLDSPKW